MADNQYIAAYYLYIPNTISKQLRKIKPRPLIILKIEIFTIYSEKKLSPRLQQDMLEVTEIWSTVLFRNDYRLKVFGVDWNETPAVKVTTRTTKHTGDQMKTRTYTPKKKKKKKKKRKKSRLHFHPEGMYENWWQVSIRGGRVRSSSTIISDTTNTQKPSSDTVDRLLQTLRSIVKV